jgi:predicted transcriptional regulator
MARVIVKKVRLTEDEAKRLKRLASEGQVSESEILRSSIGIQERRQRRRDSAQAFMDLAHIDESSHVKWEEKY